MIKFFLFILALLMSFFAVGQVNEIPKYKPSNIDLHNQIVKMDAKYFNAYNTCDMETQTDLYNENIEFFHALIAL